MRVGGAAGCNPRSPLKISILKTAGSRSSAQMIHQQLSSICLCHLQRPLLLRTPVLSNAFVIYCISLCISSSSSFQPSLFIHFHLQFDTTFTHNEAIDKLQNIRRRSQTMNKYRNRKFRLCCEVYNILAVPQSQISQNQIPRD